MDSVSDTQFISVKFRSRNSAKGSSGSRCCRRAWTIRNTTSSTTPTAMIRDGERYVPQLYRCPSTSP